MNALIRYFRAHIWQRRLLTISVALVIGALIGVLTFPTARDAWYIHRLGDENSSVRTRAALQLRKFAATSPSTRDRLQAALDTENDLRYVGVAALLRSVSAFYTPERDPMQIDRLRALQLDGVGTSPETTWEVDLRWSILSEVLLSQRDNRYIRRALSAASRDPSENVRKLSAMLAARLGDTETLRALLDDQSEIVQQSAAISAGVAKLETLLPHLQTLAKTAAQDTDLLSSTAYAISRIDPKAGLELTNRLLRNDCDDALRDRLLYNLATLSEFDPSAIQAIFDKAKRSDTYPPAMAILAAANHNYRKARDDVKDILRGRREGPLDQAQLIAAIHAARSMNLEVRGAALSLIEELWLQDIPLALVQAARLLGEQVQIEQPDAPDRDTCIETLKLAAGFDVSFVSGSETQPAQKRTPLPSAGAAVALWNISPELGADWVRRASSSETTLPGDYIAWHIARSDVENPNAAFELGLKMLPPLDAPQAQRVYNENQRAAGAMLLALSAKTQKQTRLAAKRIRTRLDGTRMISGEDDFYTAGAYRCALLLLDEPDMLRKVRILRTNREFPQRRVFTALWCSGDKASVDWLLFNKYLPNPDIAYLLTTRTLGEVLHGAAPELPQVHVSASESLRNWEVEILRCTWGVRRKSISLGCTP